MFDFPETASREIRMRIAADWLSQRKASKYACRGWCYNEFAD